MPPHPLISSACLPHVVNCTDFKIQLKANVAHYFYAYNYPLAGVIKQARQRGRGGARRAGRARLSTPANSCASSPPTPSAHTYPRLHAHTYTHTHIYGCARKCIHGVKYAREIKRKICTVWQRHARRPAGPVTWRKRLHSAHSTLHTAATLTLSLYTVHATHATASRLGSLLLTSSPGNRGSRIACEM